MKLLSGSVTDCPGGFVCNKFEVDDCPGVSVNITGELAESDPAASPRGVVVFHDGGGGHKWWADPGVEEDYLAHLRDDDHFVIEEIRWVNRGWYDAESGQQTGMAHLACRPATAFAWIHDNVYLPLGLNHVPGVCGFCITGQSAGSSAVTYPLAFYGLDSILDADIPTGGPTYSAMTKGCLLVPGFEYTQTNATNVDYAYGWRNPNTDPGPCRQADASYAPTWDADSVDSGGNDYSYPSTRVVFIIGALDEPGVLNRAAQYRDRLMADAGNTVVWDIVPGMPHHIQNDPSGEAQLEGALVGPTVAIKSGPSSLTRATTATFGFIADDPTATFSCWVDDATGVPCTSPVTYSGLADGLHEFSVQATSQSGTEGATATWDWTVDTVGPVPVSVSDTNGTTDGLIESGDTISITFDEPLATSSLPGSTTVWEADPTGAGSDQLTVTGISGGSLDTGSDGYVAADGAAFAISGSMLALNDGGTTVIVTVGSVCRRACRNRRAGGPGTLVFVPSGRLTDLAGNPATGSVAVPDLRLF
jgi:hypothetical protein